MIQYLIEMTVYDPAIPGVKTLYYSTRGYTSLPTDTPANQFYDNRVVQAGNYEQSMFQPGKTSGISQVGFGEVRLANSDGALDHLIDYGSDGRIIVFKIITALGILLLPACSMEQPEFNNSEITVRIKDPQMVFNAPIQPTKYLGNNALPLGIEGADDIKGKPKPLSFGKVFNVTPALVNTSMLIYQVHESTATVPAAYDKGVELLQGADYADQVAMEAVSPQPGEYRVCPTLGCFRLGASPVGQVTADVIEGATSADRTAAQVAKRIAARVISAGDISTADVTALDSANSAEVGIYINAESTVLSALDQVLGSVGAWYGFAADRNLRMQQFTAPVGPPDVTLGPNDFRSLDRIASNDAGRGVPTWRVNLNYAKNYTVQTSDLAGVIAGREWIEAYIPGPPIVNSAVYGNGVVVAVGGFGSTALRSLDFGSTWSGSALPYVDAYYDVVYGKSIFIAKIGGINTNKYAKSVDSGATWTSHNSPFGETQTSDLCFGNDVFVWFPANGTNVGYKSVNGDDWTSFTLPISPSGPASFVATNGIFVAVCTDAVGNLAILTSTDGDVWTESPYPGAAFTTSVWRIDYGTGNFVIAGSSQAEYLMSFNGLDWIRGNLPITLSTGVTLNYAIAEFLITDNAKNVLKSEDGVSWKLYNGTVNNVIASTMCSTPNGLIAFDSNNKVYLKKNAALLPRLSREYSTVSMQDNSIKTVHLLAPEMNVNTCLVDEAAAQAEAARLLTLHKVRRDPLQLDISLKTLPSIQIGKVALVVQDRYGYSAGKLFRVMGAVEDRAADQLLLTLWG